MLRQRRRQAQIMSSSPRKGRRSNHPYRPATSKPASSIRRRHSIAESQCSSIEAAESPERTDSRSVLVVSSQSARSKMPGSRSSQRPCVSAMSSRARGEDVEDEPAAGLEQLAGGAQRAQLLLLVGHVEQRAERADHELARARRPVARAGRRRGGRRARRRRAPRRARAPPRASPPRGRRRSRVARPARSVPRSGPIRQRARRRAPRSAAPPRRRTRCPRRPRRSTGRRSARSSRRGPRRAV